MRWVILGAVLVGCGAPAGAPAVAAPVAAQPANERAVAEPWHPPPADPELSVGGNRNLILLGLHGAGRAEVFEEQSKRSDLWDPCVRDVLADRDPAIRNELGDALTGYVLTCDRTAQRIAFEPPQGRNSQAPNTVIGLHGVIERGRTEVAFRVIYLIERTDPFERITIVAGPLRWTSPRLDVEQDPARAEVAAIPLAPSLVRVVRRMLDEPDARIRFETASSYDQVIVPEQTKQDIRVLLDALNL